MRPCSVHNSPGDQPGQLGWHVTWLWLHVNGQEPKIVFATYGLLCSHGVQALTMPWLLLHVGSKILRWSTCALST